jgi:hypothetical protein
MQKKIPFPSLLVLLPDDITEDTDLNVASYWKKGDPCILQISSFRREYGPQVSAMQRLSERTLAGGDWQTVEVEHAAKGCDVAAASTRDGEGACWVHVYLVWDWLAVHATISHKGNSSVCDWAWAAVLSIQPVVV